MTLVRLLILSATVVACAYAAGREKTPANADQASSASHRELQHLDTLDSDGTCFLCGQRPIERPARSGRNQIVSFETCCSELDLSSEGNCTGVEEIGRVVEFDRRFSRDVGDGGFFRITSMNFTNSNVAQCCNSCSCNGNFCTTFDNTVVSTLPCDARRVRKDCFGNDICAFDRDLCVQLEDPNGEQCIWDPEDPIIVPDDFCPLEYEPQLLRLQNTPPCKPGSVVKTILLQLTPLVLVESQRGLQSISEPVLTVSSETKFDGYALVFEVEDGPTIRIEASDCLDETKLDCIEGVLVQHQQQFDEDEVTCFRERTVQNSGETVIDDWTIYYDSFAVPVEFSCQISTLSINDEGDDEEEDGNRNRDGFRRLQDGKRNFTGSQLKLETISIPRRLDEAFEIGGICADPDLATPIINSDSTCAADIASKPEEEVVAQAICQQESLVSDATRSSFGLQDNPFLEFPCVNTTFCSRFARPFFSSTSACFDCFLVRRDVRFCFCNAVVRGQDERQRQREVQKCFDKVTRQGWKRTASEYLDQLTTFIPNPVPEGEEGHCLSSFDQLNASLGACEEGVLLEYYDLEFEVWRVLKAFPASIPFCRNANFTVSSFDTSPFALRLLRNTIRLRQAYRKECYRCKPRLGVFIGFDLNVPFVPTSMPSASPTMAPTGSPTKSLRSTTPTVSKKGGWLNAWG